MDTSPWLVAFSISGFTALLDIIDVELLRALVGTCRMQVFVLCASAVLLTDFPAHAMVQLESGLAFRTRAWKILCSDEQV